MFLDNSTPGNAYRLETFRSTGSISSTASQQLRCYFVTKCHFPSPPPVVVDGKTDIRSVSDSVFLEKATQNTLDIYQQVTYRSCRTRAPLIVFQVMWNVESRYGPVIEVFEVEGTRERRLVIAYKMGNTKGYFR